MLACTLYACGADPSDDVGRIPRGGTGGASGAAGASGSGGAASGGAGGEGGDPFGNMHNTGGSAGTAGGAGGEGGMGMPMENCAEGSATATPVMPTVWLVVDGSSSMTAEFAAGTNRWTALRTALMDAGGIVETLQSVVRFGMVIYAGSDGISTECPLLVIVEPALDNYAAIDAAYPADPIGMGTPTDKAMEHVVNNLPVLNEQVLDQIVQPTYVVLATDGAPNDNCGGGGGLGLPTEQAVIDVVTRGTMQGMNMFVISLAGDDMPLQTHLEQVAAATRTMTPPFVPDTRDSLTETFQMIVGTATCRVALDGTVMAGQECAGEVQLSSEPLPCNDPNGWQLEGERTVVLNGDACTRFQTMESLVYAAFPCAVFTPD